VVGINQPAKSYWQRILDYYNEFRTTTTTRTRSSLQHRWGEIQRDTTKFCGFYDEIERKNQSGKSEDDKVFVLLLNNTCIINYCLLNTCLMLYQL
jgi:hypothetical protein